MQREIEVKVMDIDINQMEEKLIELGAKKVNHEFQKNYTFVPKGGEFDNGYLRIRETNADGDNKSIELTFKEVKSDSEFRVNNEYTVTIDSVSVMIKILEQLGVKLQYEGEKERTSYSYKGQRFDLDIWDKKTYPNPYMEIEFTNKSKMDEILEDLDIDKANVTNESITELRKKLNM
ncbi:class IV adenylate cyclase [uncultured Anaerococcus sp.]|mgnify:CR=1 FL=1|uniref:class IV adenylate cyclase n=1 Tax=uncultured Anaerococcus sp. TaxID=293428 RepID=UPI0026052A62|nr:class IV adenylate cyclase [uncultured Anaerococcus sp.]